MTPSRVTNVETVSLLTSISSCMSLFRLAYSAGALGMGGEQSAAALAALHRPQQWLRGHEPDGLAHTAAGQRRRDSGDLGLLLSRQRTTVLNRDDVTARH